MITASATTRLPRVSSMLICECFLSVSIAPVKRVLGTAGIVGLDPLARGERRLRGHVLTGGVARREVDSQVAQRTDLVLADVGELARARGRLGGARTSSSC